MADQTVAASSPAEEVDVFRGQNVSFDEFSKYRQSGELPARFKPAEEEAESAPAATPEETVESEVEETESEPESEPEESQEQPQKGSGAEKRIKQLLARTKELERKLEAKQDVTPASSPARPAAPQNYAEWEKTFNADKWIEEFAKANPTATYERANAAMFSHMLGAREHFREIEQARAAQAKELSTKVGEARQRYEDYDDAIKPFVSGFIADPSVAPVVKQMVNDSDIFADLVYVLAEDKEFMQLAQSSPSKAIRYVANVERLIGEELAGKEAAEPEGKKAPEVKKTAAPKPPSPVGGTSSRAFDVSDESLSPEEWMRKRTEQLNRRRS